ncbi:hypothetical protein [Hymenobacter rubripertinctus]|uniref:Uncharacterized protein n=1 Tax=Hymenobacter rubripertinctus TaxID=2029981 RepID=A0A418R279_9BACT|nr:hypothetical protein [Hymenobacter rubripertinctus]RIY11523.1 hypothetical protein D0T11_06860 [Hymenobacter rubripertinctus]
MSLLRTILTVSLFSLLLAVLGGPLVLRAATGPARRQLEAAPKAVRLDAGSLRPLAAAPALGGQPS